MLKRSVLKEKSHYIILNNFVKAYSKLLAETASRADAVENELANQIQEFNMEMTKLSHSVKSGLYLCLYLLHGFPF